MGEDGRKQGTGKSCHWMAKHPVLSGIPIRRCISSWQHCVRKSMGWTTSDWMRCWPVLSAVAYMRYWACEHYRAFHTQRITADLLSKWPFNLHLGKQQLKDILKWHCALPVEEAAAVQNGDCPRGRNHLKNPCRSKEASHNSYKDI